MREAEVGGPQAGRAVFQWAVAVRVVLAACRREEKEFGFRGAEGRLLLLQDCGVRVQVAEGGAVSGEAGLGGLMSLFVTTPNTRPLIQSFSPRSSTSR